MSRDKVNSSILDQDTPKFFFPDTRTRYFQVKDETGYQVLVQHNHESDIKQDIAMTEVTKQKGPVAAVGKSGALTDVAVSWRLQIEIPFSLPLIQKLLK